MPDPTYTVHVTLLPNGRKPQDGATPAKLLLSALLTPSLDDSDTLPAPFVKWYDTWAALLTDLAWKLNLQLDKNSPVTTLSVKRTSADPDAKYWKALFAPNIKVRHRPLAKNYNDAWLVSHPAAGLHDRHTTHRLYDLLHRYAKVNKSHDPKTGTFLPDVRSSITQFAPHNIFLHPVFDPAGPTASVSMAKLIAEADTAQKYANSCADTRFTSPDLKPLAQLLTDRFVQGQHTLESESNMRLTGIAIFALLRHCVESFRDPGHDNKTPLNKELKSLTDDINQQALKCTTYDGFAVTIGSTTPGATNGTNEYDDTFKAVVSYVEFHLFTQRPSMTSRPTPDAPAMEIPPTDPPDFHQMLGLLHQYPAMLRPLGLAFDFEVDLSTPSVTTNGLLAAPGLLASIIPPSIGGITFDPRYTSVTPAGFLPASTDGTHSSRCLDISDDSDYVIVTEDTDGSSHKLTQQSASRARGKEYTTTAPTGLHVHDGRDHVNGRMSGNTSTPSTAPQSLPSMRTCGVALYHLDRVNAVKQSIARATDTLGQIDNPFYGEDLTLGYRVDIQTIGGTGGAASWFSLHARTSSYNFVDDSGKPLLFGKDPLNWKPHTPAELATDEGYLSFAVTQTTLPATQNADVIQQMQVHQSMLTWTGWSLSAPVPSDQVPVSKAVPHADGPRNPVRLWPTYTAAACSLPKLRFDLRYGMRLRQVDLVGNSLPVTADTPADVSLPMDNPFSRHEPIRAPQILLEEVVDRKLLPSEHIDRLVLRDKSPYTTRLLIPPREPLHLAELHGFVNCGQLPPSAFPRQNLLANGSFPKVGDIKLAKDPSYRPTADDNDAIFLNKGAQSRPKHPFYPDPLACLSRVETYTLQRDLASYAPAGRGPITSSPSKAPYDPFYLNFLINGDEWPNVRPIRIRLESASHNEALEIKTDTIPLDEKDVSLPAIDALFVRLPEGQTVMLQVTSAALRAVKGTPPPAASGEGGEGAVAYLVSPDETELQPSGPKPPPAGHRVSLAYSIRGLNPAKTALKAVPAPTPPLAAPPPVPEVQPQNALVPFTLARDMVNLQPNQPNLPQPAPQRAPPAATQRTTPGLTKEPAKDYQDWCNQLLTEIGNNPERLVDGSCYAVTPPHQITLVHAVKQPCRSPQFFATNSKLLTVERAAGASAATISGSLTAHWPSTSKITGTATWKDRVDDLTKRDPEYRTTTETAFEFINNGSNTNDNREIAPNQHHFRDTRARKVTYSLSASTRFREYFPEAPAAPTPKDLQKELDEFSRSGASFEAQVCSSVRPPAPSIAYIIPAFSWKEVYEKGKRHRGRTMVLRVYLNRPFLISGDEEKMGLILCPKGHEGDQLIPVSRWGGDPIVNSDGGITQNQMAQSDFDGGTLNGNCVAYGGYNVDILSFDVDYAPERGLWYCDIPLAPSKTASSFARLALVRWQEHSHHPTKDNPAFVDVRSSQIVFADFMQIRADRWVSVEHIDSSQVCVSVSGVFSKSSGPRIGVQTSVRCAIEHRWHRLGQDLGWRPCNDRDGHPVTEFAPRAPEPGAAISAWSAQVKLPHSTSLFKFRLLIEELEWIDADKVKTEKSSKDNRTSQSRSTYLHYIEL